MLILDDISVRIAGRLLINHASVNLPENSKIGFVGRNGTGKSTLFRVLTGDLSTETGKIIMPPSLHIGQVAQEAPGGDKKLIDVVLEADKERSALLREAEVTQNPMRIAEIHMRLADKNAYAAPARAAEILHGLGFDSAAQQRTADEFSGGWRMRVALAAMLFAEPELLLLDEPTNYLDIEGVLWLTEYIKHYPYQAIIISHDKDLLNNSVSAILHLDAQKLYFWQGNYDSFSRQRAEKINLQQKQAVKQEAQRRHMEAFVARFHAKASKAKQAQSRLKMLKKMETITVWRDEQAEPFRFPHAEKPVASPIIHLSNVCLGYEPGKPVLKNLNLRIDKDDRIALLGANGNGKSTFAKFLAGKLQPQSGTAIFAPHLKIAFFAQHQMEELHPEETPIEHFRRLLPQEPEAKLRARIARTGLSREKMQTKAQNLSGGEKARLLMGLAVCDAPHLLILDEPTNHLDMDSRDELIEALNDFEGAVILIAHDRHLLEASVDSLWKVSDGTISAYHGDIDTYAKEVLAFSRQKNKPEKKTKTVDSVTAAPINMQKSQGKMRMGDAALRKQLQKTEEKIHKNEQSLQEINDCLSHSEFYKQSPRKIAEKTAERAKLAKQQEELETYWLHLHEKLSEQK